MRRCTLLRRTRRASGRRCTPGTATSCSSFELVLIPPVVHNSPWSRSPSCLYLDWSARHSAVDWLVVVSGVPQIVSSTEGTCLHRDRTVTTNRCAMQEKQSNDSVRLIIRDPLSPAGPTPSQPRHAIPTSAPSSTEQLAQCLLRRCPPALEQPDLLLLLLCAPLGDARRAAPPRDALLRRTGTNKRLEANLGLGERDGRPAPFVPPLRELDLDLDLALALTLARAPRPALLPPAEESGAFGRAAVAPLPRRVDRRAR